MFRVNLSVQLSRVKQVPIGCPKTSVKNYQPNMHNIPEERRSPLNQGGSMKSRAGKFKVGPTGRTETTANSTHLRCIRRQAEFVSSPQRIDRLCGPPSLLFSELRRSFSEG